MAIVVKNTNYNGEVLEQILTLAATGFRMEMDLTRGIVTSLRYAGRELIHAGAGFELNWYLSLIHISEPTRP